ncbi:MAG: tRNA pseudouridine(38-40) synthase TruA [Pirellulaceae bacterium]
MERTFQLILGYDGTAYAGWQVQLNQRTIQGELERAVEELVGVRVPIVGSGRTDAGVHALAQSASLDLNRWRDDAASLGRALNTKLPVDISVLRSEEVPFGFHALRDATGKRYRYQIQIGGVRDPFEYRYLWHVHGALNVESMCDAASYLLGTHDFACFQATGSERKTTVRTIRDLALTKGEGRGGQGRLTIEVEADGFLYNMVRNIVGSLVEVGRGNYSPEWMLKLVEGRDRNQAGPTAPPQGLFLIRVDYPPSPKSLQSTII